MNGNRERNREESFDNFLRTRLGEKEYHWVKKIWKLSESSTEISAQKKEEQKSDSPENSFSTRGIESQTDDKLFERALRTSDSNRRHYDRHIYLKRVYPIYKIDFFSVLMGMTSIRKKFRRKYGSKNIIQFSFFNFIRHGALFFPGDSVRIFVKNYIIPMQNILKAPLMEIYRNGWRMPNGEHFLDPFDFNLISECERMMDSAALTRFLEKRKSPAVALEALNAFIGHYFSITVDPKNISRLITGLKKSLDLQSERLKTKDRSMDAKTFINMIHDFFQGGIEEKVLIPLMESYYCRTISLNSLFSLISLDPIAGDIYYADDDLQKAMHTLEDEYGMYIAELKTQLKKDIHFIKTIRNDLDLKIMKKNFQTRKLFTLSILDLGIRSGQKVISGFPMYNQLLKHHKALMASYYFVGNYAHILLNRIELRSSPIEPRGETVELFSNEIFMDELKTIRSNLKRMRHIGEKPHLEDILNIQPRKFPGDIESYHLTLNLIADQFFSIARKLYNYFSPDADSIRKKAPLFNNDMGRSRSYFEEYILLGSPGQVKMASGQNLFQKTIKEILLEIRAYSLQYTYEFEYQHRIFKAGSPRNDTLRNLLSEPSLLELNLDKLEGQTRG